MRILSTTACVLAFSLSAFAQQSATPAPSSTAHSSAGTASQHSSAEASEPTIPPPANPITAAQIKELQEVTGVASMQKRIIDSAMQFYRNQFPPFMPQDVIDDLTASLEKVDLGGEAAGVYPKYISTEDATKLIEFYKSPAGQRYVKAQPAMMSEMQRAVVQSAQQTAKDVITRHKPEIEAAQQKYMQEHQQPKPSLNTPEPMTPAPTPKGSSSSSPQQ